ncbi:hypothetical protein [Bacteroides sedimenti]|uniref:Uncharacterized protein n=1 Tax=Bacteroides sedimenti TaxID=2136147 RepID=A0ABM8I9N8_9BACE
MKKIEWFWNVIHYMLYRWDINFSIALNYALPFYWINKIPVVKRHKARNGMPDMNGFYRGMMNDPKHGASIMWASIHIGGIIVLIEFSIYFLCEAFTGKDILYEIILNNTYLIIPALILQLIIPYWINNQLLFKNDKYLDYFTEFDLKDIKWKIKWGFITLLLILFAIGSFWGSLILTH